MSWALALTAVSGLYEASAQDKAGRVTQRLSRYNSLMAQGQAADALARGVQDEQRFRRRGKGLIGKQRAGYAGQGVQVDSGSAAAVQEDTGAIIEEDATTIRLNAAREAWGFQIEAGNLEAQGNIARTEGRNRAIGTLLSTGAQLYGQYDQNAQAKKGQ